MSDAVAVQGQVYPYAVEIVVSRGARGYSLATASAPTCDVTRPDGTTTTWAVSIAAGSQSSEALTLLHPLQAGDVALLGHYALVCRLTFADGQRLTWRRYLTVVEN